MINVPFCLWFLWLFSVPPVKDSIEAGIGVLFVGIFVMGPGTPLFFVVAGVADLLFLQTGLFQRIGESPVKIMMVASALVGWASTGYAIGLLIERRASRLQQQGTKQGTAAHRL